MSHDLAATSELLDRQMAEAIATDPIAAVPLIAALQKQTERHLREAVRQAVVDASWSEVATALGVSKQAAHQRFREYAKGVGTEIRTQHRTMKRARRHGDLSEAAQARARRDELKSELRVSARSLKVELKRKPNPAGSGSPDA